MIDSSGAEVEIGGLAPFGACSNKCDPGYVEQKLQ